jgi:hypothetical protein
MATFGTNQRLELVTLNRTTTTPFGTIEDILTVPSGSNFFIFINRLYASTSQTFSLGIRYKNVPIVDNGVGSPHPDTSYNWAGAIGVNGTLRMDYNQNPDFVGNANFPPVPMEYGDRLLYPEDKLYCWGTNGLGNNILVIEYTKVFYGGQDIEV